MRRGFLLVLVAALAGTLSGCATYTKGYFGTIRNNAPSNLTQQTLPPQPPAIIRGQTLQYYGHNPGLDEMLMERWQSTGLFSGVTRTEQGYAPATGSYLSMSCSKSRGVRNSHGLIGGFLWLSSAAMLMSSVGEESYYCTMDLYQNGVRLGSWSPVYSFELLNNSWLFWAITNERKVKSRTRDNFATAAVATAVHDLKERFP